MIWNEKNREETDINNFESFSKFLRMSRKRKLPEKDLRVKLLLQNIYILDIIIVLVY